MIELKLAQSLALRPDKKSLFQSIATSALLAGALLGGSHQTAQAQSAAENAYFNSQYGYCDAKKIAHVWGKNVWEGKVIIGNKILAGLTHLANADIESTDVSRAAPNNRIYCTWEETELSYNDAAALGRYWNQSPNQAKSTAAFMASKMGTFKLRQAFYSALRSAIETPQSKDFAELSIEHPAKNNSENVFARLLEKAFFPKRTRWHETSIRQSSTRIGSGRVPTA